MLKSWHLHATTRDTTEAELLDVALAIQQRLYRLLTAGAVSVNG